MYSGTPFYARFGMSAPRQLGVLRKDAVPYKGMKRDVKDAVAYYGMKREVVPVSSRAKFTTHDRVVDSYWHVKKF